MYAQASLPRMRFRVQRLGLFGAFALVNAGVIVYLWLYDGGISNIHGFGDAFTSIGRITGLLGAFLLLIQILLLARIKPLERLVGFDRLTVWHRVNGKVCLYLILAHVIFITLGYAALDRISVLSEVSTLFNLYPDMIQATIGTALIVIVAVSSFVIARRRLKYETWYFVHLTAYLGVLLAWYHQIPTGNEFILNASAGIYWTLLYLGTLGLIVLFRLALPTFVGFRYQLRVAEVTEESQGVYSLRITGRHLDRMHARAGQFFLWRLMTWKLVWQSHPFSLSAAPDGQSLRITIKSLGDFTRRIGDLKPGTRVLGVGPFGHFTSAVRRLDRVVLIAGGVGITPIRALLEELSGDIALVYRVVNESELVFRDELEALAKVGGFALHYVTGDHRDPATKHFMSPEHLKTLLPDLASREVYVCGPPAMSNAVQANVRRAGVPQKQIHTEAFAF